VAQYDSIALDYQRISAAVPLRDAEWYSLHQRLGDRGEGFWDEYVAAPPAMHVICQK